MHYQKGIFTTLLGRVVKVIASAISFILFILKRFFKIIALIVIGAIVIGIVVLIVATLITVPYIPFVGPDPVVTGYIGLFAGLMCFLLIPLTLITKSTFSWVWGHGRDIKLHRTLLGLWIVCLMLFVSTLAFTARNFSSSGNFKEVIVQDAIEAELGDEPITIKVNEFSHDEPFMKTVFGNLILTEGQLIRLRHTKININKGHTDSIKVSREVYSQGNSRYNAKKNANHIVSPITYVGRTLELDNYFTIPEKGKYRGQTQKIDIDLPIGTRIRFEGHISYYNGRTHTSRRYNISETDNHQIWTMTEEGLQKLSEETI